MDRYGVLAGFTIGHILDAKRPDAESHRREQARGPGPLEVVRRPALRAVVDNGDMADGHLIHRHRPCQKRQGLQAHKQSGDSRFTVWPCRAHALEGEFIGELPRDTLRFNRDRHPAEKGRHDEA